MPQISYEKYKENDIPVIEEKINYVFKDKSLLTFAFTHISFKNEHSEFCELCIKECIDKENKGNLPLIDCRCNEKLEFLGDSTLGLVISEYLSCLPLSSSSSSASSLSSSTFSWFHSEGILTSVKSRIVNNDSCANYTMLLKLPEHILLGEGARREIMGEKRGMNNVYSDLFEAVIGAIFMDGGYKKAKQFILNNEVITEAIKVAVSKIPANEPLAISIDKEEQNISNWKGKLLEFIQDRYKINNLSNINPVYVITEEGGLAHMKWFRAKVIIKIPYFYYTSLVSDSSDKTKDNYWKLLSFFPTSKSSTGDIAIIELGEGDKCNNKQVAHQSAAKIALTTLTDNRSRKRERDA